MDTSALVKLVHDEPESAALRAYLRPDHVRSSSSLAAVELPRAIRRLAVPFEAEQQVQNLLASMLLIGVDQDVLIAAASITPPRIRTLDAIHLASALVLGDELEALLTYDARMAEAARSIGVRVEAPA